MQSVKLYVLGMHCNACTVLIETKLKEVEGVEKVVVSLNNETVEVSVNIGHKTIDDWAKEWTELIKDQGYSLSIEKNKAIVNWQDFKYALPIAGVIVLLFIMLQKLGIVNLIGGSEVNYTTALFIGFIASISTCMAVVGGLVLSMSANFAKQGDAIKPQIIFHISRLVSFFILGGLVGMLGSAFKLSIATTAILSVIVAVVLLALGINLLDIFSWSKKLVPTLPSGLAKKVSSLSSINHTLTPVILGAATFILPCGFTQSMQIYSLSTGSFMEGALVMFMFALGTLPILALLSFSSFSVTDEKWKGVFFKSAGLVVIFFGIYNLANALAVIGLIPFIFNF